METDPSPIGGPADLGKGLFGYRKADVQQLISDRDVMLEEAEQRIRRSEARISQLERALGEANDRIGKADEELGRLRGQLQALMARRAQVEQLAGRVQTERQRVAEWRRRAHGIAGATKPAVDRLLLLLDELPTRVEEALSPVADRIAPLTELMSEFAPMARVPIGRTS